MKLEYTISRDDLKQKNFKAGVCSTKGQRPATPDYHILSAMILKILTKP